MKEINVKGMTGEEFIDLVRGLDGIFCIKWIATERSPFFIDRFDMLVMAENFTFRLFICKPPESGKGKVNWFNHACAALVVNRMLEQREIPHYRYNIHDHDCFDMINYGQAVTYGMMEEYNEWTGTMNRHEKRHTA